jgi:hypothetical protein
MNTSKHPQLTEEEVLLAFAVEPRQDRATLTRYLVDYPEHSVALANLSIELMIDETRNNEEGLAPSIVSINKAWQRFMVAADEATGAQPASPFSGLNPAQLKQKTEVLGINKLFLVRLRDRGIDLATIPSRFIESIATAFGSPVESVRDYLASPPSIDSSLSFRSDVKPAATEQVSFTTAIETSQLTVEQKAKLKALMEG